MQFVRIALAALAAVLPTTNAAATPDTFTYQGVLEVDDEPYTGTADFNVFLIGIGSGIEYDTETLTNVQVTDGRFQLDLDFTSSEFYYSDFELNIHVRAPSGSGSYTELTPNQPIHAVPYAFTAESLAIPADLFAFHDVPGVTISQANTGDNDAVALRVTRGTATDFQGSSYISRVIEAESEETEIGVIASARYFGLAGIVNSNARSNGIGVFAEVPGSASNLTNPSAVYATNAPAGTRAQLATVDHAAEFIGDIYLSGGMTKTYATGTTDLPLPVAFGFINADGTTANGTPNFSSVWSTDNSQYEILIDNETYFYNEYVTIVTPISTPGLLTRTNSRSGRLVVYIDDRAGNNRIQGAFTFVVYKTSGAAVVANQRRAPLQPLQDAMTDAELNPYPHNPEPRPFIENNEAIPSAQIQQ